MDTQRAFINLFASFYRLGFSEAQSCSEMGEQDFSAQSILRAQEFYQNNQPLIDNLGIYAFLYESELTFTTAKKE
ncbi:hypothetical protein [Cellulophaga sp. BC115SP]|uniref:hypothetical protein n=1 Tax=Cellulophaga sp. BC115SP TaxID=2683263 RepID=UPI001412A340|nr:hypothetical protein [Cellulophaga sp. BC115SP]NBB30622.1 hypothetical protein [Cellulophaga sp. BC115SP]